jgi:membrane-associated phospholipid phosphatase
VLFLFDEEGTPEMRQRLMTSAQSLLGRIWKKVMALRLEELLALLFLLPSFAITIRANLYFHSAGLNVPRKFSGGITRLWITALLMAAFFYFVKKKPLWKYTYWIRDVTPFLFCIAIYTNLHDTIGFVNPFDIHDQLIAIDQAMFGVQPCVWAQQFYHPLLTDYFSVNYMNYFLISVAVVVYLLVRKRDTEMRMVLLGTILCFYMGYFLYILFPAAPPRLTLAGQFNGGIAGGWFTIAQNNIININPSSSRAAFPSLHCAVTLISIMYSWRYNKKLFWSLLIPGVSLVLATVYLRHHYVIDILAGFALAILSFYISPTVDRLWKRLKSKNSINYKIDNG